MIEGPLLSRPVASRHGIFFWLGRNLVRVRYTFFLVSVLAASTRDISGILVWVGVVLVSILIHELGHATAARRFGQNPKIELHAMGGTTSWAWVDGLRWSHRLTVSLAGPGVGILAGLMTWAVAANVRLSNHLGALAVADLIWVNVGWSVFNLLPILPLDGGQAMETVLERRLGADRARHVARVVSSACGGAATLGALLAHLPILALICAAFTWDNLQRMRGLPGVALPR